MVLPSSGTISLNDVNVELGKSGTTTASMDSGELRALATGIPFTQGTTINMSDFYGDAVPYYTFNESYGDGSNGSSLSRTVDIGTANAGRIVVLVFFTSGNQTISSVTCTIGGVSATRRVGIDNNNQNTASIFTLPVTSGTTASVTFTADKQFRRSAYSSYSVYYPRSSNDGVVDTDTATNGGVAATSSTLSFTSHPNEGNVKGIFIGGFQTFDNSGTIPTRTFSTNSGNTVTNDGTIRHGTENRVHTVGSYLIGGEGSPNSTVTCTFDTSRLHEGIGAVFF